MWVVAQLPSVKMVICCETITINAMQVANLSIVYLIDD